MTALPVNRDPFDLIFAPADEVAAGLAVLEYGEPLWGDVTGRRSGQINFRIYAWTSAV
jgi:hypothetical protein